MAAFLMDLIAMLLSFGTLSFALLKPFAFLWQKGKEVFPEKFLIEGEDPDVLDYMRHRELLETSKDIVRIRDGNNVIEIDVSDLNFKDLKNSVLYWTKSVKKRQESERLFDDHEGDIDDVLDKFMYAFSTSKKPLR